MVVPARTLGIGLWTDDIVLARAAAAAGVVRIGPDLEILGKHARQPGAASLISGHSMASLPALRHAVGDARFFMRSNPPHPALADELSQALDAGVAAVMLPMVRDVAAAHAVAAQLRGRAELIVMIEHADALPLVDALASIDGVTELYVGTNDLALSLGLPSRFATMTPAFLAPIAAAAHAHGRRFAFFGLGSLHAMAQQVSTDVVLAEWVRYGVTSGMIARSFGARAETIAADVEAIDARFALWQRAPQPARDAAHREFLDRCAAAARQALDVGSGGPGWT